MRQRLILLFILLLLTAVTIASNAAPAQASTNTAGCYLHLLAPWKVGKQMKARSYVDGCQYPQNQIVVRALIYNENVSSAVQANTCTNAKTCTATVTLTCTAPGNYWMSTASALLNSTTWLSALASQSQYYTC